MSFNLIKKRIHKSLNRKWHNIHYILKNKEKFNDIFFQKYKHLSEVEHQLARHHNMQDIVMEIKKMKFTGDVIEFGTWQGLGLIYFANLFNDSVTKYIGIDSFEGLPISSSFWKKGDFDDTNIEIAKQNFDRYSSKNSERLTLIKGWFNDPIVKTQLFEVTKDVILIHFDADLGVSTTQALNLIKPFLLNRTKPIYFLFDDWGCHPDEVPDAFFKWVEEFKTSLPLQLTKISSSRYTRYYRLDF